MVKPCSKNMAKKQPFSFTGSPVLRDKIIITGSWKTRQTGLVMKYHFVTKVAGQAMTKNISLFLSFSPPVLRDKRIVARSWKTMMQTGLVVRGLADCCFGRMMVGPARQGSAHERNTKTHKHILTQTDPQGNTAEQKYGSRA